MVFKFFGEINFRKHTLKDIKKMYRELLLKHHPDHGGTDEATKSVIEEFKTILRKFMASSFEAYQADRESKGQKRYDANLTPFINILEKIMEFDIEIEVIGYWIYAFKSFAYKTELANLGFWFSSKHKAWVYNGSSREKYLRTKHSLNAIRGYYGSEKIKIKKDEEKEEVRMIEYATA